MDDLDFSMIDVSDAIELDDTTGMPSLTQTTPTAIEKEKKIKTEKSVEVIKEKEEDLIEIPDEPEEKKVTTANEEPPEKQPPSSSSVYEVLINALHDKGVLSSQVNMEEVKKAVDEGIDPTDIVFELMDYEISQQVNNYINSLPDKIKNIIENYRDNVPFDELLKIKSEQQRLDNIPLDNIKENIDLQKEIVRRFMMERGENETKIAKYIKRLEEYDDLEEEALESYKSLETIYQNKEKTLKEKAVEEARQKEVERQNILKDIKKSITSTQEIIPGIKLMDKDRDAIFNSMTKPIGNDEFGRPVSVVHKTKEINPIEFEKALHYYHYIGLFNFDKDGNFKPDFSKLIKTIKSDAVNDLSMALKREEKPGGGRPPAPIPKTGTLETNVSKIERFLKSSK